MENGWEDGWERGGKDGGCGGEKEREGGGGGMGCWETGDVFGKGVLDGVVAELERGGWGEVMEDFVGDGPVEKEETGGEDGVDVRG